MQDRSDVRLRHSQVWGDRRDMWPDPLSLSANEVTTLRKPPSVLPHRRSITSHPLGPKKTILLGSFPWEAIAIWSKTWAIEFMATWSVTVGRRKNWK